MCHFGTTWPNAVARYYVVVFKAFSRVAYLNYYASREAPTPLAFFLCGTPNLYISSPTPTYPLSSSSSNLTWFSARETRQASSWSGNPRRKRQTVFIVTTTPLHPKDSAFRPLKISNLHPASHEHLSMIMFSPNLPRRPRSCRICLRLPIHASIHRVFLPPILRFSQLVSINLRHKYSNNVSTPMTARDKQTPISSQMSAPSYAVSSVSHAPAKGGQAKAVPSPAMNVSVPPSSSPPQPSGSTSAFQLPLNDSPAPPAKRGRGGRKKAADAGSPAPKPEKRGAIFKKKCPQNILDRVERVMTQRCVQETS